MFELLQLIQREVNGLSENDFMSSSEVEDTWIFADTQAPVPAGREPILNQDTGTTGLFEGTSFRETTLIPGTAASAARSDAVIGRFDAIKNMLEFSFDIEDRLKQQQASGPATVAITVPNAAGGFSTFHVSPNTAAQIAQRGFEFNETLKRDLFFFNNLSVRDVAELEIAIAGEQRLSADLAFRISDAQSRLGLAQQQLAIDVEGLNIQRSGLQIQAIADDFNRLAQIGQITHQEAALNLSRIDTALNQRRASREELYRFAVKRSSLIQREGELVTRLPFSEQIAMSLSGLSGGPVDIEDFELPVGFVDPDAEGQAVLDASAFPSQIPGLQTAADEASAASAAAIEGT